MPTVRDFNNRDEALSLSSIQRRERSAPGLGLIPEDFASQVYFSALGEGDRLKARLVEIDDRLKIVKSKLADARRQVKTQTTPILRQHLVGGVLDREEQLVTEPAGAFLLTPAALATRKKIELPLQREKKALELEKSFLQQELGELSRIARAALGGEVSLIHHLSDRWRSRLKIGAAVLGKLPKPALEMMGNVLYTDAAGNPLPPEALDPGTKKPDLAPGMRGSEIRKN